MSAHLTHSQTLLVIIIAWAAVLWTAFWLWVAWMAVVVLRNRYLVLRAQQRALRERLR